MTDAKEGTKPRKVIDVTAPGKSTPPTSGRPIIVTNRPVLKQDPMMMPVTEATEEDSAKKISRVSRTIPSLFSATTEEKSKSAPALSRAEVAALKSEPSIIKGLAEKKADPEKEPGNATVSPRAEDEANKEQLASAPTALLTDEEPKSKEREDKEGEIEDGQLAPNQALVDAAKKEKDEKAAQVTEQEKIIESRKYYLPINTVEKRRLNQRALLLLVLVIVITVAWLDITLDAGIIKLGNLHSVTHFFNP